MPRRWTSRRSRSPGVCDERDPFVSRRSRKASPDYATDADRGSSDVGTKRATFVDPAAYAERAETRAGARDLDAMVEAAPGLSRQRPRPGAGDASRHHS